MIHQDKEVKNIKSKPKTTCACSHDEPVHSDNDGHDHGHDHDHDHGAEGSLFKLFLPALISLALLLIGIGLDHYFPQNWFTGYVRIGWYIIAYLPVGLPVLKEAYESIRKGD
ncbi:heavy metal translocating P-type ATPase, partial [Flavobacterium sp. HMWF030]